MKTSNLKKTILSCMTLAMMTGWPSSAHDLLQSSSEVSELCSSEHVVEHSGGTRERCLIQQTKAHEKIVVLNAGPERGTVQKCIRMDRLRQKMFDGDRGVDWIGVLACVSGVNVTKSAGANE